MTKICRIYDKNSPKFFNIHSKGPSKDPADFINFKKRLSQLKWAEYDSLDTKIFKENLSKASRCIFKPPPRSTSPKIRDNRLYLHHTPSKTLLKKWLTPKHPTRSTFQTKDILGINEHIKHTIVNLPSIHSLLKSNLLSFLSKNVEMRDCGKTIIHKTSVQPQPRISKQTAHTKRKLNF